MAKIKNLETLKISNFFKQNRFSKICKCSKTSQFSKFLISVKGLNWKPVNIQIFQLSQIKQILWNMRVLKKISSFLSVTFQYKGQSKKLRNLGKFQLLQIKQIWNLQVLKTCFDFSMRASTENLETLEFPTFSSETCFLKC